MPKDTLEQRLEAARVAAIAEQARLQSEQRASGEHWNIAPLEDRIEFAQQQAKSQWERDLDGERSGRADRSTERDPFIRNQSADQNRSEMGKIPEADRDLTR